MLVLTGMNTVTNTNVHGDLLLFLIVYVEDFKLSGRKATSKRGWELLRRGLEIQPAASIGDMDIVYLR